MFMVASHKEQKLVVIGDKAMAVFDDTVGWNHKLALYRHRFEFDQVPPVPNKADVEYITVPEGEPLKEECQYFGSNIRACRPIDRWS